MSHLTSTLIDDESLIEELKRYGEKNLPTLPQPGSRKKANQLNDQNREIYLKKLNHYKAREKAESNPSKQYLKQQLQTTQIDTSVSGKRTSTRLRSPNTIKIESSSNYQSQSNGHTNNRYHHDDDDEDDDIIEIDATQNTSEYVQVSNAYTSPLSASRYIDSARTSTSNRASLNGVYNNEEHDVVLNRYGSAKPDLSTGQMLDLKYVSLKDQIDLDKTLSKYRSEIHNIVSAKNVANLSQQPPINPDVTKKLYCPRPTLPQKKVGFLDSIKSTLHFGTGNNSSSQRTNENIYNEQRDFNPKSRNGLYEDPISHVDIKPMLPQRRESFSFTDLFFNKFMPLVSKFGLQISNILPYVVIVIFTIILLTYYRVVVNNNENVDLGISSSPSDQSASAPNQPVYKNDNFYCEDIKDTHCSQTKFLIRELIDYLRFRSGQIECSSLGTYLGTHPNSNAEFIEKCVHLNKIKEYFVNEKGLKLSYEKIAIESVVKALTKHIPKYPHWGLRLLNADYKDTEDIDSVTYVMSTISSKSVGCRFKELLHFLYVRMIMLATILVTLLLCYLGFKTLKRRQIEKDTIFYNLVSNVTNMVEKQYQLSKIDPANTKPFVAISHVYDSLVDPSQRASKKKLWNKVVKFIEDHESRIHLETQFIDGEETHVWKWIVPTNSNLANKFTYSSSVKNGEGIGLANSTMISPDINSAQASPTPSIYPNIQSSFKVASLSNLTNSQQSNETNTQNVNGWQGDAFNKSEKLMNSPTPCLKIRNMFDTVLMNTDSQMAIKIHNDILEKCFISSSKFGSSFSILHISCDKKSKEGCVYVKCSSNEAAGHVYQNLNGTWYSGKLLNVKFLRNDRYLERFPESAHFTTPLQPILI